MNFEHFPELSHLPGNGTPKWRAAYDAWMREQPARAAICKDYPVRTLFLCKPCHVVFEPPVASSATICGRCCNRMINFVSFGEHEREAVEHATAGWHRQDAA